MGSTSRTCLLIITINLIQLASAQEVAKRAPHGFLGLRGKKYFGSNEPELFIKRRPQFFDFFKGKKNNMADSEHFKRNPAFFGMRGKKSYWPDKFYDSYNPLPKRDGTLIGQIDYTTGDPKQTDYSLLRGFLAEYLQKLKNEEELRASQEMQEGYSEMNEQASNEISKREVNRHQIFAGRDLETLRNKRPIELSIRGKFLSVRGKKDQELEDRSAEDAAWIKRSQKTFFGMRGKKWDENDGQLSTDVESPN